MNAKFPYEDILYLSRPVSAKHPPMRLIDRAAQFAPFAALGRFDSILEDASREWAHPIELAEEGQAQLNRALCWLHEHQEEHPQVVIRHYAYDIDTDRGIYEAVSGKVAAVNAQTLVLENGQVLAFSHISQIQIPGMDADWDFSDVPCG